MATDLDNHDGTADPKSDLLKILEVARFLEIPLEVFNSNSGSGFHVYLFFNEPVPAWKARGLLLTIIDRAGVKHTGQGGSYDAVFPKQDRLEPGEVGNLIALPYHGKAMERGTTLLLNGNNGLQPHGDSPEENQEYFLENLSPIDEPKIDRLLLALGQTEAHRVTGSSASCGKSKERLTRLVDSCAFLAHFRRG